MTEKDIKKLKLEHNECLAVSWLDTASSSGWNDRKDLNGVKCADIKTLGFWDGMRNGGVVIKHNLNEAEDEGDYTIIPIGCVYKIKKLIIKDK